MTMLQDCARLTLWLVFQLPLQLAVSAFVFLGWLSPVVLLFDTPTVVTVLAVIASLVWYSVMILAQVGRKEGERDGSE